MNGLESRLSSKKLNARIVKKTDGPKKDTDVVINCGLCTLSKGQCTVNSVH